MVQRRKFLQLAAGVPAAFFAPQAFPAFADSSYQPGPSYGWTGYANAGGIGYTYIYLYSGPSSESALLGSIAVNDALSVVGYATGEELAPHNPLWYNVQSPQGSGWVYSGLVSRTPPVLLSAAQVASAPGPIPAPVGSGHSIGISLSRQWLWAYDGGTTTWNAPVTTGAPDKPTPTGLYYVQAKIPNFVFHSPWAPSSPYWYPDSPTHYALQFRTDGYYIHDAPWRPYYGPGANLPHLDPDGTVREGSHGCVNTQLDTIEFLANWTPLGAPVRIIY